jgi:hypothetical protein
MKNLVIKTAKFLVVIGCIAGLALSAYVMVKG